MDTTPCPLREGDYVLATKYQDGDPGDRYCTGFYAGSFDHFGQTRHLVNKNDGTPWRANGFRRCEKITDAEGRWLVARFDQFEPLTLSDDGERLLGKSVWDWRDEASTASGSTAFRGSSAG